MKVYHYFDSFRLCFVNCGISLILQPAPFLPQRKLAHKIQLGTKFGRFSLKRKCIIPVKFEEQCSTGFTALGY